MNVTYEISSDVKTGVLQDVMCIKVGFEDFIKFVIKTSKMFKLYYKMKVLFGVDFEM